MVARPLLKAGAKIGLTQAAYRGGKALTTAAFSWVKTHFVDAVKTWLKSSKVVKWFFSTRMVEGIVKFFAKFGEKAAKDGAKLLLKTQQRLH